MKKTLTRAALIFTALFIGLFLLRLGYGYATQPNGEIISRGGYQQNLGLDFTLSRKNYAGQKKGAIGSGPQSVDQRYEKIATLAQTTHEFEKDEGDIRAVAKAAEALVQHEQSFGLEGRRQLQLALGVPPGSFDDVIGKLRAIGTPVSFQVNKTDKTNEYRALLAQQESLAKSRDNLIELKARDAKLSDLISLERQILELETQIQGLGVSVGEFDSEFEFVTIKMTLSEVSEPRKRFIPLIKRAKVALEWTALATFGIAGAFFLAMLGAALLMVVVQMARKMASETAAETDKE